MTHKLNYHCIYAGLVLEEARLPPQLDSTTILVDQTTHLECADRVLNAHFALREQAIHPCWICHRSLFQDLIIYKSSSADNRKLM